MATSLYKGQIPVRTKGQITCLHHKGGQLDLYCKNCKELACIKCLSTVHYSHPLCALSEITSLQKRDIQNFVDKTEKTDLVQVDQYIIATDEQLKDNSSNFEKLSHQLKTQTNKLKDDLDLLTAQTLSVYQQMEEDNAKLLQAYKQDLKMHSTQLKQQVQECKITIQRGSDIQIYDTGCEIKSPLTYPVKPTLGKVSFTPNQNPQGHLEQALGEVNTSGQMQGQPLQGHERSVGSSTGFVTTQHLSKLNTQATSTQQRSKGRNDLTSPVYTQTEVLGEWESPCYITSICPTTDGQVWISYNNSNSLTLLDREGKVIQQIKYNIEIRDISLSPTTNTLWVCDQENNITELVSGRLVHRFSTSEVPLSICITDSNDVIVGMARYLSKFTTKGKSVHNTLVCRPYRISECPTTHNVAVADWGNKHLGGEGKQSVVVMDTDFKELFVYSGEVPHTYQPTSQAGGKPFNPWCVVYDSVGNLVIGDRDNKRILLINGRGEFLRIIHTYYYGPQAVGVDREDVLCAVFRYNKVKRLQYSSV